MPASTKKLILSYLVNSYSWGEAFIGKFFSQSSDLAKGVQNKVYFIWVSEYVLSQRWSMEKSLKDEKLQCENAVMFSVEHLKIALLEEQDTLN